jgi:hypothetical protein
VSEAAPDPAELRRALRRVRGTVLVGLGACALLVAMRPGGDSGGSTLHLTLAFALALASILTHQMALRPGRPLRGYVQLWVGSVLCAGAIGVVGVAAWYGPGNRNLAIGCLLCAALFTLRPQTGVALRRRDS